MLRIIGIPDLDGLAGAGSANALVRAELGAWRLTQFGLDCGDLLEVPVDPALLLVEVVDRSINQ